MPELGTVSVKVEVAAHVWMYHGKRKIVLDDIDAVEPIAEQIEAMRQRRA